MIISDVICEEEELEMSYCNARMMVDTCNYNQSVWLNCNNDTGDLLPRIGYKSFQLMSLYLARDSVMF